MNKSTKNKAEGGARIHLVRRDAVPFREAVLIRVIAVVLAFLVCGIVTVALTGENPALVFESLIRGNFGTGRKVWIMLQNLAMLLCVSLALTPAFRMRFWNIGGEGQVLMGCLATAACMLKLGGKIPNPLLYLVMTVSAIAAGAVWAGIPAFFKAKWNTNETLFTLMMNYVASQLVAYFIIRWEVPKGSGKVGIINAKTHYGWLPQIGQYKYLLNVLIVAAVLVLLYIYLAYSKHGYEISVVGHSEQTARYIGIKVEKVIVRTLLLSGAICGLTGLLLVAGTDHTITTTITASRGFTGVMVAWMGHFNPIMMILSSFIIVFMGRGASEVSTTLGLNESFGDIMTGIIIFFIIGSEFFVTYKLSFGKAAGKEKANV